MVVTPGTVAIERKALRAMNGIPGTMAIDRKALRAMGVIHGTVVIDRKALRAIAVTNGSMAIDRKALRAMCLIVIVALMAVGCRTQRQVVVDDRTETPVATETPDNQAITETPDTPAQPVQKRALTVTNFTATVAGVSVDGQLRMAEDSVIWVNVSKLFELGRAMATPDSVWVNAPLLGRSFAGNYADASRLARRTVSYTALQSIVTSADAERQLEALAATLGIEATVKLGKRRKVDQLSFPFSF